MTESYIEPTDAELVAFFRQHAVKLMKAPIVAGMAAFSIWMFSGSIVKALIIAVVCIVLSAFNTWRRFLEPLAFWGFALAVIYWCDADILAHLKSLYRVDK